MASALWDFSWCSIFFSSTLPCLLNSVANPRRVRDAMLPIAKGHAIMTRLKGMRGLRDKYRPLTHGIKFYFLATGRLWNYSEFASGSSGCLWHSETEGPDPNSKASNTSECRKYELVVNA